MYHILIPEISNSKMMQVIPVMHGPNNYCVCMHAHSHTYTHTKHTKNKGAVLSVLFPKIFCIRFQKYPVFVPAGSDFSSESLVWPLSGNELVHLLSQNTSFVQSLMFLVFVL